MNVWSIVYVSKFLILSNQNLFPLNNSYEFSHLISPHRCWFRGDEVSLRDLWCHWWVVMGNPISLMKWNGYCYRTHRYAHGRLRGCVSILSFWKRIQSSRYEASTGHQVIGFYNLIIRHMWHTSKAQSELSWTWYSDDWTEISLAELEAREAILLMLISRAQLRVEWVLNAILQSRVTELKDFASKHISGILYELASNGWLTSEELEHIKSLPESMQLDAVITVFRKLEA